MGGTPTDQVEINLANEAPLLDGVGDVLVGGESSSCLWIVGEGLAQWSFDVKVDILVVERRVVCKWRL